MLTQIQSRCGIFLIKTSFVMPRFYKARTCLRNLHNIQTFQKDRFGPTRLLHEHQTNEFSTNCRHHHKENTLYLTRPTCKPTDSIAKQRIEYFTVGRVMYKPLDEVDVKRAIGVLTDKFIEARELLSDARESEGTVYFSEDMEEAQEAVNETLDEYADLLSKLNEEQRQDVLRTIGLKMEELKAQLQALVEELKEEH